MEGAVCRGAVAADAVGGTGVAEGIDGLAEASLERRGEARGEDRRGREPERGGKKPQGEAPAGERHGGVLCRNQEPALDAGRTTWP